MKVTVALLADHAVAQDDGKVYVLGGGLDRHVSATFPCTISLALVVKVAFTSAECGREHRLVSRILAPSGQEARPAVVYPLRPVLRPEVPGDVVSVPFVQNVKDLPLSEPGVYAFLIGVEDAETELARLELVALQGPNLRGPAADVLTQSLNAGFQAFDAGHVDAAVTIYEKAAADFPNSPDVHNNLGFTLLVARQPERATQAFAEAARLGYPQNELLQANRACCAYLSGAYEEALEGFQTLLQTRLGSAFAVLCAIQGDDLHPLWLSSAGDLVALAALNAGWASVRSGHRHRAQQFSQMAIAGRLSFTNHNGSLELFGAALDALTAEVSEA